MLSWVDTSDLTSAAPHMSEISALVFTTIFCVDSGVSPCLALRSSLPALARTASAQPDVTRVNALSLEPGA